MVISVTETIISVIETIISVTDIIVSEPFSPQVWAVSGRFKLVNWFFAVFGGTDQANGGWPWEVPKGLRKLVGGKTAPAVAATGKSRHKVSVLKDAGMKLPPPFRRPAGAGSQLDPIPGAAPSACPRLISLAPPEPARSSIQSYLIPSQTAGNHLLSLELFKPKQLPFRTFRSHIRTRLLPDR